jgi:hypothetical protein
MRYFISGCFLVFGLFGAFVAIGCSFESSKCNIEIGVSK